MNRREFLQASILSGTFMFFVPEFIKKVQAQNQTSCLPMCLPGSLCFNTGLGDYVTETIAIPDDDIVFGKPTGIELKNFSVRKTTIFDYIRALFD